MSKSIGAIIIFSMFFMTSCDQRDDDNIHVELTRLEQRSTDPNNGRQSFDELPALYQQLHSEWDEALGRLSSKGILIKDNDEFSSTAVGEIEINILSDKPTDLILSSSVLTSLSLATGFAAEPYDANALESELNSSEVTVRLGVDALFNEPKAETYSLDWRILLTDESRITIAKYPPSNETQLKENIPTFPPEWKLNSPDEIARLDLRVISRDARKRDFVFFLSRYDEELYLENMFFKTELDPGKSYTKPYRISGEVGEGILGRNSPNYYERKKIINDARNNQGIDIGRALIVAVLLVVVLGYGIYFFSRKRKG